MASLRELIVRVSADTQAYQTEMARASRVGSNYYKTMGESSRRFEAIIRQNQAAIKQMNDQFNQMQTMVTAGAAGLIAAFSVKELTGYADEWGQYAIRVKHAIENIGESASKYNEIQDRLFSVSQRNAKAIEESQELFIQSSKAMQELGYSTEGTLDFIESISSSLTINAASSAQAESAINALSKAMVTGKLNSESFNTIAKIMPTVVGDIAKAMGKTESEVKALAQSGKLSMTQFANAVINAKDRNNELADSMDNTLNDGWTQITNAVKKYVGEANQANHITSTISRGMRELADNFAAVGNAGFILAGVGIARYFGNLSSSMFNATKEAISNTIATQAQTLAQIDAANATLNQINLDKAHAVLSQQSLSTQLQLAQTEKTRTAIRQQLAANSAVIIELDKAEIATKTQLAAAQSRLTTTATLARSALNLIGGPMGAAMLAGGALMYLAGKTKEAKQAALDLKDTLPLLSNNLLSLSENQLSLKKINLSEQLEEQLKQRDKAIYRLESANSRLEKLKEYDPLGLLDARQKEVIEYSVEVEVITTGVEKLRDELTKIDTTIEQIKSGKINTQQVDASDSLPSLSDNTKLIDAYDAMLDRLTRQKELFNQTTEAAKTRYEIEKGSLQGLSVSQQNNLINTAAALDNLQSEVKAQEEYNQLMKSLQTDEEKLLSTTRERLDLLNKVTLSSSEYAIAMEKVLGASFVESPDYGGLDPSVGGPFGEIAKTYTAEGELDEWFQNQLELLDEYRSARSDLNDEWDLKEQELHQQHQDRLEIIESARQQASLSAGSQFFGNMAGLTKAFAGQQSGAYRAMFAISKAFAIAESIVAIQTGIANAAKLTWPANLAAMGSVVAATSSIVSTISSTNLKGMAHDGIDSIPQEGTWLLDRGERVVDARTNADLKDFLNNKSSGNMPDINIVIENNGAPLQVANRQYNSETRTVRLAVKEVANQIENHSGEVWSALSSGTNTTGRTQ